MKWLVLVLLITVNILQKRAIVLSRSPFSQKNFITQVQQGPYTTSDH